MIFLRDPIIFQVIKVSQVCSESIRLLIPIIIEIVDTKDKIESFLPLIDDAIEEGLVTLEKVEILLYKIGKKDQTD